MDDRHVMAVHRLVSPNSVILADGHTGYARRNRYHALQLWVISMNQTSVVEDPKVTTLRQSRCLNPHPEAVVDPMFADSDFFDPAPAENHVRPGRSWFCMHVRILQTPMCSGFGDR